MTEQVCFIGDKLRSANNILEAIEFKLFGGEQAKEPCNKECSPQNVQAVLDRTEEDLHRLLNRLDELVTRI
jgi:hypothetical protein